VISNERTEPLGHLAELGLVGSEYRELDAASAETPAARAESRTHEFGRVETPETS
jgi:hypothetical protein